MLADTNAQAVRVVDVLLERSERGAKPSHGKTEHQIKTGQLLWVHSGSAAAEARVHLLGQRTLGPGEQCFAQLRLAEKILILGGDRIVLRDWGRLQTLAGGLVLDPLARTRRFRRAEQAVMLEARAAAPESLEVWARSEIKRHGWTSAQGFLGQTRFSASDIQAWMAKSDAIVLHGPWIMGREWWDTALSDATTAIERFHQRQPQDLGMKLGDLRTLVEQKLPDKKLFELLLEALAQLGYVRTSGTLRSPTHVARLPGELQQAGDKLRRALAVKPIEPPNPKELAPLPVDQKALKFLIETGEAIFLDEKAVILMTAYDLLKNQIAEHLRSHGRATAAELREVVGTTRRILIPLLEKLDKEGFTKRDGDYRTLKQG